MQDYKLIVAQKAIEFIKPNQIIGLGDGSTILNMLEVLKENEKLISSLIITSPSVKTINRLDELQINYQTLAQTKRINTYFDGCDAFDRNLNALKSGSGIHTLEKIAASMANDFILIGDAEKYADNLPNKFPVVIEIFPDALYAVTEKIGQVYPDAQLKLRKNKDGDALSPYRNYLLEVYFTQFPDLEDLDIQIKMIPGVANHSLFYNLATKAVIAGPNGLQIL